MLTVPLKKGKHQQLSIEDVQISYDEDWQKQHLASFKSAYGNAPFFDHYFEIIQDLYENPGDQLYPFNWTFISKICSLLNLQLPTESNVWQRDFSGVDLRDNWNIKNYTSPTLPHYNQLFEDKYGYLPNLCILDLLFCKGPEARSFLQSTALPYT